MACATHSGFATIETLYDRRFFTADPDTSAIEKLRSLKASKMYSNEEELSYPLVLHPPSCAFTMTTYDLFLSSCRGNTTSSIETRLATPRAPIFPLALVILSQTNPCVTTGINFT